MSEPIEDKDKLIAELTERAEKAEAKTGEVTQLKKALTLSKKQSEELAKKIDEMGDEEMVITNGVVEGTTIMVQTAAEYAEYSAQNGRYMGRKLGTKTKPTIEELRACINSNWTPKRFMDKHGLDADDLKQIVWKLSLAELRGKSIKYSIEQNFFSREG